MVLESGILDMYTADLDGEGDWELPDLTGGHDLRHCRSVRVDYGCLQEVCLAASLAWTSFVLDLIRLAIQSVSALTHHPAVDPRLGTEKAMLATRKERVNTLESPVASKDTEIVAETTQLSNLGGACQDGRNLGVTHVDGFP